tara:strand:+ start:383 stop:577 length:195 start_codon:yes stop_codon:yes gene_type:complete
MLDAYIIEKLRRQEREKQEGSAPRLHIEPPTPVGYSDDYGENGTISDDDNRKPKRGVVEIDFNL